MPLFVPAIGIAKLLPLAKDNVPAATVASVRVLATPTLPVAPGVRTRFPPLVLMEPVVKLTDAPLVRLKFVAIPRVMELLTLIVPPLALPRLIAGAVIRFSSLLESSSVLAVMSDAEPRSINTLLVFGRNVTDEL